MVPPRDDPGWAFGFDWEYALTEEHDVPPPGKGWKRVYTLSISSVAGAGGSPARRVDTRGTH